MLILKLIAVIQVIIHAMIPVVNLDGKVIKPVMMKIIIVDVNGMEETVAVMMLTHNIVQLVNVCNQLQLTAVNPKVINHHIF